MHNSPSSISTDCAVLRAHSREARAIRTAKRYGHLRTRLGDRGQHSWYVLWRKTFQPSPEPRLRLPLWHPAYSRPTQVHQLRSRRGVLESTNVTSRPIRAYIIQAAWLGSATSESPDPTVRGYSASTSIRAYPRRAKHRAADCTA